MTSPNPPSPAQPSLPRIAVIEDDQDLLDLELAYLQAKGYPVWGVTSAEAFYKRFMIDPVDVVILDLGLPGEDGLSVARHLSELPRLKILIVSARDDIADRIAGLAAGADRYLVKPVDLDELIANIQAVSRHPANAPAEPRVPPPAAVADEIWRLDQEAWRLIAPDGKALGLSSREFALLRCLFLAQGQTVQKKALTEQIYTVRVYNGSERLDVLLARLRKKGQDLLGRPLPIMTAHRVGYAFTAAAELKTSMTQTQVL